MPEQTIHTGSLERGQILDGYRIERELGRGAMSVVYLATQLDLQRVVALKLINDKYTGESEFITRFFNEAKTVATLSHPGIIRALGAGQTAEGAIYFSMEYVDGVTLQDLIDRDGRLDASKVIRWFMALAVTLDYGWTYHGFVHGDIKPGNIMLDKFGHVKLADFGLAHVREHDYPIETLMLTPHYAAPELIQGVIHLDSCCSDIYAFGATLYHALSGTPVFPGDDPQEVMRQHLEDTPEPLSQRVKGFSQETSDFVMKLLAREPADRPANWKGVIEGLKKLRRR